MESTDDRPLAMWNLSLAGFSFCGAMRTMPYLLTSIVHHGSYYTICEDPIDHYGRGAVAFWATIFVFSKIPELIDTVFIVLRKKPLLFLHWYHHITVMMYCWQSYGNVSSSGLYFVSMNYCVHAVMYFYYFLTAIGQRPKWAFFVTIMQLSQVRCLSIVLALQFLNSSPTLDGRGCLRLWIYGVFENA